MINNEILSFIKDQVAQGATKDQIKNMLVTEGGWDDKDVEEAYEATNFSGTSYPSVLKNAETLAMKSDAKDETMRNKPVETFPLMPELSKTVSPMNSPAVAPMITHATSPVFSPGLSHVEQPKSMQPSVSVSPSVPPPVSVVATPAVSPVAINETNGANGLNSLREKMALGISQTPSEPMAPMPSVATFPSPMQNSVPAGQPMMSPSTTQVMPMPAPSPMPAMTPNDFPAPAFVAPSVSPMIAPTVRASMPSEFGNGMPTEPSFPQPAPAQSAPSSIASKFSFFKKASALSSAPATATSSPAFSAQPKPMQPVAVFPKDSIGMGGGISRLSSISSVSPTPAQLLAMRGQQKKSGKGGRFFFGLFMLIVGIALGGISMNAYMNGYVNTSAMNGLVEKSMDMIGLGTTVAPATEAPPLETSKKSPASTDSGS